MVTYYTDESTPILAGAMDTSNSTKSSHTTRKESLWSRIFNPVVTSKPRRLFEICDLSICPSFIRHRVQATLTAAWTHHVPLLQKASPAKLAAGLIMKTLDELSDFENSKLSIVDFCSGAGGPIPTIENLVNSARHEQKRKPIPFLLTDLHPHIDSWMRMCSQSHSLNFIPQSVDATDPPIAVTSFTSPASQSEDGELSSNTRVFRLYCLAFHHFDDELARKVLESTMQTADGFAIIELQDRRLGSLMLIFGHILHMLASTPFFFWKDPLHLFFTYIVPVLPVVVTFDGLVSCLRVRSFKEVMALIGGSGAEEETVKYVVDGEGRELEVAERGEWCFESGREFHTWPCGYMNWVVGYKKS